MNTQICPKCGFQISAVSGSVRSKCLKCGYKDGCCGS